MNAADIMKLTDEQVSNLLYALCRSGKVVIPQYYTQSNINEIKGKEVSEKEILDIQFEVEQNDSLMEEIFGNIFA
jgi:hypothetical protein